MQDVTNSIINEITGTNGYFDDGLQDIKSRILESNENNTQLILTEQFSNFSRGLSWIDEGMKRVIEAKNKDANIILKAQEDSLSRALIWIKEQYEVMMKSINNVLQEVRVIKRSNRFDDLKQLQQPLIVKESRRKRRPGYPSNHFEEKEDVKKLIMLAARDFRDISDLWNRLQDIYIEG
jgi:hypothetical protein